MDKVTNFIIDALDAPVAYLFHMAKKEVIARASLTLKLIDSHDLISAPTSPTIVFGAGAISGTLGKRAAEFFLEKKIKGDVFFVGGGLPDTMSFASYLLPKQADRGIFLPQNNSSPNGRPLPHEEAPYMADIFRMSLAEKGTAFNEKFIHVENPAFHQNNDGSQTMRRSLNAQENISFVLDQVMKPDAKGNIPTTINLVTATHRGFRILSTARKILDEAGYTKTRLRMFLAWPEEAGITSKNWKNKALALYMVVRESNKYNGEPDCAYVKKGFCVPLSHRQIKNDPRFVTSFHP